MDYSVKHTLGQAKARQVADAAFASYRERFAKYQPTATWRSPSNCAIGFNAKGLKLTGSLTVTDTSIDMTLDVPLLLRPFKTRALGVISAEIQKWLDKARAGEI